MPSLVLLCLEQPVSGPRGMGIQMFLIFTAPRLELCWRQPGFDLSNVLTGRYGE